jgi:hypothetical protein
LYKNCIISNRRTDRSGQTEIEDRIFRDLELKVVELGYSGVKVDMHGERQSWPLLYGPVRRDQSAISVLASGRI